MMDIETISKKIREEKDNLVAKAFVCQIASLLLTNGIVPIMTEYRKEDLESITDTDRYKLVYELGVTFDKLDTNKHDKQIRAEVIAEISREMRLLYGNEYEKKIRADVIDETISRLKQITNKDVVIIEKANLDDIARELKEQI